MLEHLKGLRFDWSDEIPERVIHSDDTDNLYKVRRNWFTGVAADVYNLLNEGFLTDSAKRAAAEQLLARFASEEFSKRALTTAEDIQKTNELIDIILDYDR